MTLPLATQRMTRPLLTIAAILVCLAFGLWGVQRGVATLAGVLVGLSNWFALRWLMQRLVLEQTSNRAAVSLLLIGKIGLLMAAVFILISRLALDPIGVAFGLSVLFVGPVIAGLLSGSSPTQTSDPAAVTAANVEARAFAREPNVQARAFARESHEER
jgi:hypothetical protein